MAQTSDEENALVLMSGGQDSTTCLFWALKKFRQVSAITFFYGQKHEKEIRVAQNICSQLNIENKLTDISFIKDIVISNLFEGSGDFHQPHPSNPDVPSSFVPYRNLLFLTIAAGWAGTIGAKHLVTGVCETDYSGYADCRDVFIKSAQATLNLATDFEDNKIVIHTPLMWLTKAREFALAEELGCLEFILRETLTCYDGDETMNDFGKGCGKCPSCGLRKKGFQDFLTTHVPSGI
jgi:7-cyano-7-deazaguanine synthase